MKANEYNMELCSTELSRKMGITIKNTGVEYKHTFWDDKNDRKRYVFKIRIQKGRRFIVIEFGQSYIRGNTPPTVNDILGCLPRQELPYYEDFCNTFEWEQNRKNVKMWKEYTKQYDFLRSIIDDETVWEEFINYEF
jgi:hypothetical protein